LYRSLVQGNDGNFYGTTWKGGSANDGTVFKMTPAGVLTTLASLNFTSGALPLGGVVQGSDGNFYGTTQEGGAANEGAVFQVTPAGVLTTAASFTGSSTGQVPGAGLMLGRDGNFYGTAEGGSFNGGVIFQLLPPAVPALPRWGEVALVLGVFMVYAAFLRRGTKLNRGSFQ
jgi:uncharacterized repeat protein (TIGR03803 family)